MARPKILKLDVLVRANHVYVLHGRGEFQTLTTPQAIDLMQQSSLTRVVATRDATDFIRAAAELRTPTRRLAIGGPQVIKFLGSTPPNAESLRAVMDAVDCLRVAQGGWHLFDAGVDAPQMNVLSCETAAALHPAAAIRDFFVTHGICDTAGFNMFLDLVRDPRWFVTHDDHLKFTRLHAYLELRPSKILEQQRQPEKATGSRLQSLLGAFRTDMANAGCTEWFSGIRGNLQHPRLINKRLKRFVSFVATAWLGGITHHPELIVPDHFFAGIAGEKQLLADWKSTTAGCLRRF